MKFNLEVSKEGLIQLSLPHLKKPVLLSTPDMDALLFEEILGLLREGGRITIEVKSIEKEISI